MQQMGTVPGAPCQLPWCVEAKVSTVLRVADVQGDQADPTAALEVSPHSKFTLLCSRANVMGKVRPDLVAAFAEATASKFF